MQNLLSTLALLAALLILRALLLKALRNLETPSAEIRRRWFVQVRNLTLLGFFLGLVVIWAAEIKAVALSLVAVAVAVVITAKELISCLTGSLLRTFGYRINIGDRIEVGGHRGEVIDLNPMTTTILQIGPSHPGQQYTGRSITLPNALFFSSPVVNETYTEKYTFHVVQIPLSLEKDWKGAEKRLLEVANSLCAPYLNEAGSYMEERGKREGLAIPSVEPKVSLSISEPGEVNLMLRMPVPSDGRGRIEQEVIRQFLEGLTPKGGKE
jgi:small-conductance mechanosensitive channel